jgi:hypothetical protein
VYNRSETVTADMAVSVHPITNRLSPLLASLDAFIVKIPEGSPNHGMRSGAALTWTLSLQVELCADHPTSLFIDECDEL